MCFDLLWFALICVVLLSVALLFARAEDQLEQFLYLETKAGELSSANTQLQRDLSNARDQIKLLEDHIRSYERSAESVLDGAYEQTLLFEGTEFPI